MRFLTLVSELMILNVIYVITCIPVVTIGAATSALYRTMLDKRYGLDAGVKKYFHFFAASFRQSTVRFLICVLIGAVLVFDVWYTYTYQLPMRRFFVPAFLLLLTLLAMVSSWVLALTGQFNNTAKNTFKNAGLLALRHLPASLLMVLRFVPLLLSFFSPGLFLVLSITFILVYFAVIAYLAAGPLSKVFLKLMTPEEAASRTESPEED